ncbi:MAG: MBOAT family protein [Bacteroidetes bacterium]|nr:MAG: MBOAT family protein [Bacteroidota bacterium]TAF92999.1 MAG: MBOAT family protein [Bacteroidota bacterium]
MLFNSYAFAIFFCVVYVCFWALYKIRLAQQVVLLAASIYFYSRLHALFPMYLGGIVLLTYVLGRLVEVKKNVAVLALSVVSVIATLLFVKYTNFLGEIISPFLGNTWSAWNILVPVGISFYTFNCVGYVVDVYQQKTPAERNLVTFASYISFFPHLLIGPIAKSTELLPQFKKPTSWNFLENVQQPAGIFLWGLFKKIVVADNIELTTQYCLSNFEGIGALNLMIGAFLIGVHIYADFSGYSDMAYAVAKALGFDIIQNFQRPLFYKNLQDFWKRWHASLTIWFNDYIFTPIVIAQRDWGMWAPIVGILITFLVSGIWHGAGFTFVVWGLLHGTALAIEIGTKKTRKQLKKSIPSWLFSFGSYGIILVFLLVTWVVFKSNTLQQAWSYCGQMFSLHKASAPQFFIYSQLKWVAILFLVEALYTNQTWVLACMPSSSSLAKNKKFTSLVEHKYISVILLAILYALLIVAMVYFNKQSSSREYYYFKF